MEWDTCDEEDPFGDVADFSQETARRPHTTPPWHWYEQYHGIEKYDWEDPRWRHRNSGTEACRPVPLTKGFFMVVSPQDYDRMTYYKDGMPKRWHAHVQRDETGKVTKVYAVRRGRNGEKKSIFAHRELRGVEGASRSVIVDHVNGISLDNRRSNLYCTDTRGNNHNTLRKRTVHHELPKGVERLKRRSHDGQPLYCGIRAVRLAPSGKGSVKTFRSRAYKDIENAVKWYENQVKKICRKRTGWAHNPESVSYPKLPPTIFEIPF